MKLFVTGGSGLFGTALLRRAGQLGIEVVAPSSAEFDISDPTKAALLAHGDFGKFDWVLNLAAYTKVDQAETEREQAAALNAVAPGYLANACEAIGARLMHFSTDYVFDGAQRTPYVETDPIRPIQFYGQTKAEGEAAVLESGGPHVIARVSWLFGPDKPCFPQWVRDAYLAGKKLRIVDDQYGVPSSTSELSRMVLEMVQADIEPGIYHVCGSEAVSRLEYAKAALDAYFRNRGEEPNYEMEGVPSSEFPTPAARPMYSVLSDEKISAVIRPHAPISECLGWL